MITMFSFLKDSLKKFYASCTTNLQKLLSSPVLDEHILQELEKILLTADIGITLTRQLIEKIRHAYKVGIITSGDQAKTLLEQELLSIMHNTVPQRALSRHVYVLVGINGSGKTTCAAKLAYRMQQEGKKVLLVAGDTFRAAATEQLVLWGERLGIQVVTGTLDQDPAAVIFSGCKRYFDEKYDAIIIDTAGRLQTKINLMHELEKIKRVITRLLPSTQVSVLLTIDALLGQNSLQQAQVFHESTQLDGVILTKMDSTSKGGVVFAIAQELRIPVVYIACGEKVQDLYLFNAQEYVKTFF
jgi:fused signal recognition particle receptor